MKASCPSCGAEVPFQSRFAFMAVCKYCKSTIVRHDKDLELLGKMSDMPEDMSPIQIGTTGIVGKDPFEVIGRQKIGYSNGVWNEWYLSFKSGKDGWLSDAQGFYMISFEERDFKDFPDKSELKVGNILEIKKTEYSVDDVHEVTCRGSEGELPFKCLVGRKSLSVDLRSERKGFANFDYAEEEQHLFVGRYFEVEDLKLENLRQIEGW
ncbi:MAG TPA: DUF4178 domain-containing protein [Leptospiraceae bacterium]|nr:DUF4178 domain-containing protein [Leptospiraceae bacterium]HMW07392.1 DUF4178 domain-containing protein [Leptospiraceae bacterium]HMY32456.1 DUF4178 domain-containing protein [Leptospiraceae bacterium]HMZ64211.1 DUF4178 domain-containing protein [Leptospiraceae bacterium]HNA08463.1 DUF4178 domain-containing protein [Leptospiraceae bacterium]